MGPPAGRVEPLLLLFQYIRWSRYNNRGQSVATAVRYFARDVMNVLICQMMDINALHLPTNIVTQPYPTQNLLYPGTEPRQKR